MFLSGRKRFRATVIVNSSFGELVNADDFWLFKFQSFALPFLPVIFIPMVY